MLTSSRQFERILTRPASEVDDLFVIEEFQPRQDMPDRFRAISTEAVVEFRIPISHERRPAPQHKCRMQRSQAQIAMAAESRSLPSSNDNGCHHMLISYPVG